VQRLIPAEVNVIHHVVFEIEHECPLVVCANLYWIWPETRPGTGLIIIFFSGLMAIPLLPYE
jgi:hypothetical protein